MVPVKIECGCGQRYSFDVEPVNEQMPCPVKCPACGLDGTSAANEAISYTLTFAAVTVPTQFPASPLLVLAR